jgi:hypothetical protein
MQRLTPAVVGRLPFVAGGCWQDMTPTVVGCRACLFDRQVYGIEIEFA